MNKLINLITISRPRFWLYLAGPFLVGSMSAYSGQSINWAIMLTALVYFTFPANLLVYGVNDIYDFETDKLNPKKKQYEQVLPKNFHSFLWKSIIISNLPFITLFLVFLSIENKVLAILHILSFMFFSVFYSAPPIRAKTKPVLDSIFNILYIFPASFAYYLFDGQNFSISVFFAAGIWAWAMHAFSAIPDIEADSKAGLKTIATILKRNGTLLWCASCYLLATILSYPQLKSISVILLCVYLSMLGLAFLKKDIFTVYRIFPIINAAAGFLIFLFLAWQRVQWAA